MAGPTTRTSLADSVPTEYIAEVNLKVQEGPVMRNLIEVVTLPENEGSVYEETEFTRATAYALTEGVDMAQAQEITDASMEITPAEIGAQVVFTDLVKRQIARGGNVAKRMGEILGNSIITKEDVDLLTLLDGFSVDLGSAGTTLTSGYVMAAGSAVRAGGQASGAITAGSQEPAPDPIQGVFNDNMMHNINKQLSLGVASANDGVQIPGTEYSVEVLKNAAVRRIGGVDVYRDNNIGKDANDDCIGGVFSKRALRLVRFGGGPKMEAERDPSLRATELNIWEIYGTGEWKDAWGRQMTFDGASATS
ncbi:MAG TPA: hypothetical protein VNA25_19435 [Phycisphaerae bacterium]|nr:hypothetical protein [Phycisphaerae bacterium]